MLNVARVDNALKMLAINSRYRFNAHQVAYLSHNENVNEVYSYLKSRTPYILEESFEVLCPNRFDSAAEFKKLEDIPDRWIECRICGEEFIPNKEMVHIVFYFSEDYLKQIKVEFEQEKKSQHSLGEYQFDQATSNALDTMSHSMSDLKRPVIINQFYGGNQFMAGDYNDNSTTISGGNIIGNQFAAGSSEFKGTITNTITKSQEQKLENLTENLIKALKSEEKMTGANPAEIADAVNQVRDESKKRNANRLSINGILTGINMVMQNVSNISQKTISIYQEWHQHIHSLFNS